MNQQNKATSNRSEKGLMAWLAEHPFIRLLGTMIAIIGGIIGIVHFVTGQGTLPELLARFNHSYYDDFNSPLYEGKYDENRWRLDGNPGVLVEQRDGALVIQTVNVTESDNRGIHPIQQSPIPFDEFKALEAKVKMGGSSGTGFIKTQAFTIQNEKSWWIECKLEADTPGQLYYACNVETGQTDASGSPIYSYETPHIAARFDTWYLSRFEVDHQQGEIRFYLDHRLVGKYTQASGMDFASLYPQFGSWVDPVNDFIAYYDDIRIEASQTGS